MSATIKSASAHAASGTGRPEAAPGPAQPAVEVIALTTRDDFLLELGQCLEGAASIAPVETSSLALAAAARSRRVQVLVVDSRDVADLRAEIDLLQSCVPALTALVFAAQDAEVEAAAALKGSNVFAVLPLPIDARKTAAIFEGAVADAQARREAARAEAKAAAGSEPRPAAGPAVRASAAAPASAAAASAAASSAAPREAPSAEHSTGGGKLKGFALAGIACLAVAGAAAWFLTRGESPPPSDPAPASAGAELASGAPPAPAPAQGDVDELLEKARIAMRERRYMEPANNSALLYYRSAVEADPANAEARDGLQRLRPVIVARFDELARVGRHDDAAGALAQLESAVPDDPAIGQLRLRLASARIAKAIEAEDVERATALIRSAQAVGRVPAAQLAKWRAEISRLNEKAKQDQLAERKARDAAAAEQKAREARAAEAARATQAARERDDAKKLEAQRAEQAALAAAKAAAAEASARASASQRVEPRLKRNVAPEFPAGALEKGLAGVVTVAYTVDVEGKTQDVSVESSEPPGVFDQAATNAVKRWRFEPATVDGVPTEARLRISIRFEQPK